VLVRLLRRRPAKTALPPLRTHPSKSKKVSTIRRHQHCICSVSVDARELHWLTPIIDVRIVSYFPLELYPHSIQPSVARYYAYNIAALYMFVLITIGSPFR
jgi:hypothetical protein